MDLKSGENFESGSSSSLCSPFVELSWSETLEYNPESRYSQRSDHYLDVKSPVWNQRLEIERSKEDFEELDQKKLIGSVWITIFAGI